MNLLSKCNRAIGSDTDEDTSSATQVLQTLNSVLPAGQWAVTGGTAVTCYLGKEKCLSGMELDILVMTDQLPVIREHFTQAGPNLHGLSVSHDDLFIECQAAVKRLDREALFESQAIAFDTMDIPIVPLPYLLVYRALPNNKKAVRDFTQLAHAFPDKLLKARILCKQYRPNDVDDFDTLVQFARCITEEDARAMFGG